MTALMEPAVLKKQYGIVGYDKERKAWYLACEPHVTMRLKRVFGKLEKGSQGVHFISDNPENARDIAWFLSRYPMEVKDPDRLYGQAQKRREQLAIVESIISGRDYTAPQFKLALPARDYQKTAAALWIARGGLLLGDDVGLGKTATAICALTEPMMLPAVVVTLTHLPRQWREEINRFAPGLFPYIVKNGKPFDMAQKLKRFPDVVILNYHKLAQWAEMLVACGVKSIIFDECITASAEITLWPPTSSSQLVKLQCGDIIASFAEDGSIVPDTVSGITCKGKREVWRFTLADGRYLECTDNEKILTMGGWKYASEIISEAIISNEIHFQKSTDRTGTTGDTGVATRRLIVGSYAGVPTNKNEPWCGSIPVRGLQSSHPEGLRQDSTENGREQRLRETVIRVLDRNNTSFRILTGPVLQGKNQDSKQGMASHAGLERGSDLVHGRWTCNRGKHGGDKYPFFFGDRGFPDEELVQREGDIPGCGCSEDISREALLDPAISEGGSMVSGGENSPVRPDFHELQTRHSEGSDDAVQYMWSPGQFKSAQSSPYIEMQLGPVCRHGEQRMADESDRSRIQGKKENTDCQTVQTLHGDIGARNPETLLRRLQNIQRAEVQGNPSDYPDRLLLVRESGESNEYAGPGAGSSDMRSARVQGASEALATEPQLRLSPCHLVSIERIGEQDVYDIETQHHHTLIAGGFAVHNCQELRKGAAAKDDKKSAKYTAAEYIISKVPYRIGLSATPIYNYGVEFYSVVNCLCPGELGTKEEFASEWCGGSFSDKATIKNPKAFGSYLRDSGMMMRRTRKDVGRELPDAQAIVHYVESDESALNSVSDACAELAKLILSEAKESERGSKMHASEELSNLLRQATGISKAPYVAEFVRLLIESGEPVVLYGWHHAVYSIWMDKLKDFKPALYTGRESIPQKEESKRRFVDGETPLMIVSLRSGAGLDGLQKRSRIVCFGELDWSPGVHGQCLSSDTEVLTPGGFRFKDDVSVGDAICGFDMANGALKWVSATDKIDRSLLPDEQMFAVDTEKIDLRVTCGHRLVVRRKRRTLRGAERSPWELELAESVAGKERRFIPICGSQDAPGVPLSDFELRLVGWFLTDGGLNQNTNSLHVYQAAHQPWNADIVEVLSGCGLRWSMSQRVSEGRVQNTYRVPKNDLYLWSQVEIDLAQRLSSAGTSIRVIADQLNRSPVAVTKKLRKLLTGGGKRDPAEHRVARGWKYLSRWLDKDLSPLLEDVTREQLKTMLRGINMGDGSKHAVNVMRVTNTNKIFLDRLQSLCIRRGMAATISERSDRTKANRAVYDIYISDAVEAFLPGDNKQESFRRVAPMAGERVWCLTNELGTLVTRRNGKVSIVGNCIGRVHRDGQERNVLAYYLVSESGSDPTMSEVLGIKKQQIDPITRNPGEGELVQQLQTDGGHIRRLAQAYLNKAGARLPETGSMRYRKEPSEG